MLNATLSLHAHMIRAASQTISCASNNHRAGSKLFQIQVDRATAARTLEEGGSSLHEGRGEVQLRAQGLRKGQAVGRAPGVHADVRIV